MEINLTEKMKEKPFRKAYFERDFYKYCNYYFNEYYSFDTPDCLLKYYKALESWKNVYFKWFRWSAKTTIAQMFVNYCIAYRKRRNIMWYSQTIESAEENLTYIANSLIWEWDSWERFIRDFWNLYYRDENIKHTTKKQKRLNKFITENECYVRAMSLWTSPRWKNYTASDWKYRPDLLIFDDVDTINSCMSKKNIDKWFEFLLNEVLWWTTSACQLIFLWNTIYDDWLVPRFEEHIKNDKNREIIILPIYDNWKIVRDRFVETDEEAEKLNKWITDSNKKYTSLETEKRRLWSISFWQNYLLVPYSKWWNIITRDMIRYDNNCINYWFDRIQIWVDPAISEKEWTDRFAITVCWFDWKKRYILESIWLEWNEKNIKRAWYVVKSLYDKYRADRVIVETVAYQAVLKTIFSDMWMAVTETKTSRDKVTRLLEKQSLFEDWLVYFYPDKTRELVDELLQMPNGEFDDMVDSMLFSLMDTKQKFFISAL